MTVTKKMQISEYSTCNRNYQKLPNKVSLKYVISTISINTVVICVNGFTAGLP